MSTRAVLEGVLTLQVLLTLVPQLLSPGYVPPTH